VTDAEFYRMLGRLCDVPDLACNIQKSSDKRATLTQQAESNGISLDDRDVTDLLSVLGNICWLTRSGMIASSRN
jgi:hypothetical protein